MSRELSIDAMEPEAGIYYIFAYFLLHILAKVLRGNENSSCIHCIHHVKLSFDSMILAYSTPLAK